MVLVVLQTSLTCVCCTWVLLQFRGHYCVDGGVMAFIPSVPEAEYTVKVRCKGLAVTHLVAAAACVMPAVAALGETAWPWPKASNTVCELQQMNQQLC
jgi:hypothetical protein